MENVFVTFTTNDKFCKLCEITIKSVHLYSNNKIIMYCVGFDKPKWSDKYENLICKNIPNVKDKRRHIMRYKSIIILDAIRNLNVKNGIYIEADEFLIKNPEKLFKMCEKIEKYPLTTKHPQNPTHWKSLNKRIREGKKPSMPFMHTCVVLFNNKCENFIQEWLDILIDIQENSGNHRISDEVILNITYWKNNVDIYIEEHISPNYKLGFEEKFFKNNKTKYFLHGCKNFKIAHELFHNSLL